MCDSTVTFPGLTFTLTLQLGRRAVNPAPLIGARGKFTSEKVWKDGANGVMEVTPAASRDGRAFQGSEPPPVLLGWDPRVSSHRWEPEPEPLTAPGQRWAHPGVPDDTGSPHPTGCRCPGMRVMGTGYPHPAEDWGARALQGLPGSRGVPHSPPIPDSLTSRAQSSSCWSGFSWSFPGTGGTQPSPTPGAGPVRPTEGRGGRRALPQSSQLGKLRHEGAAGGDQP